MPLGKRSAHQSPSKALSKSVAERLRSARAAKGLTQEQVADKSGLSVQHIRRLEGATSNPTLGSLEAVAKALGLAVRDLVG